MLYQKQMFGLIHRTGFPLQTLSIRALIVCYLSKLYNYKVFYTILIEVDLHQNLSLSS